MNDNQAIVWQTCDDMGMYWKLLDDGEDTEWVVEQVPSYSDTKFSILYKGVLKHVDYSAHRAMLSCERMYIYHRDTRGEKS